MSHRQDTKITNPVAHGFGFGCGIMLLIFFVLVVLPIGALILLGVLGVVVAGG